MISKSADLSACGGGFILALCPDGGLSLSLGFVSSSVRCHVVVSRRVLEKSEAPFLVPPEHTRGSGDPPLEALPPQCTPEGPEVEPQGMGFADLLGNGVPGKRVSGNA